MAFCSFAEGAAMFDVTPIENMFLVEYLPIAPNDYLRVYLYARMLSLHPELGGSLEDVAKALRLDEEAVANAFVYWEREGLVVRLTDKPPTYALRPMRSEHAPTAMEREYYEFREYNSDLQDLFGPDLMHPQEFSTAHDWISTLGFAQDAALRMVEYVLAKSKSKPGKRNLPNLFRRIDKQAVEWAERGIHTLPEVERASAHDEGSYQAALAVVRQFSLKRQPTADEVAFAGKWLNEWQFSQEEIIAACAETVKTSNPSFAYLDAILKNRRSGSGEGSREGLKRTLGELGVRSPITPAWQKSYDAMLASGFAPRTIELAAVQLAAKNRHRFEDLEWIIGRWGELNLFAPEAAEAYIAKNTALTRQLLELFRLCGLDRRPTMADLQRLEIWKAALPEEIIAFAAECARGKKDPMSYMNKLIGEWEKARVRTLEDARAQNAAALAGTTAHEAAGAPAQPAASALNYAQRDYKEEDFGDDFFFDPVKELGGKQS